MQPLLDWTLRLDVGMAVASSLVVNVIVFLLTLGIGFAITRIWRARPVASPAPPLARVELALAASCVVLNSLVMFTGWALFRASILKVDGDERPWRWAMDAVALVLVMDLAMYLAHRLAHHPIAFRFVHGLHHRYEAPRPLTLFVLHPIEVLGFGGLWVAVLCTHSFSLGGMLAYLTVNTTFGVVGHVGVEPLPRAWVRWPLLGMIGTSTFHARHHQTPTSNYGFYTALWDRLLGTLDPSYAKRFAEPP
jgi:lathosterol oxidase